MISDFSMFGVITLVMLTLTTFIVVVVLFKMFNTSTKIVNKEDTFTEDTFIVDSPEDMRLKLAQEIMKTGKPMQGTVDWDEETGKGIAKITEGKNEE